MKFIKPELEIGREYTVELYPTRVKVLAKYVGESRGSQVFANDKQYLFVLDHWITQLGEVITHKDISSFSVALLNKEDVKHHDSELIDILDDLGELVK